MSDALSFAEIEREEVELLPARTVLSVYCAGPTGNGLPGAPGNSVHGADAGADGHDASATVAGKVNVGPGDQCTIVIGHDGNATVSGNLSIGPGHQCTIVIGE